MPVTDNHTLGKDERLCKMTLIEKMFGGGKSSSMVDFPLRLVYMRTDKSDCDCVKILVSVSKRHFKRSVKRNRVKRQIREAYRKNKCILLDTIGDDAGYGMALAFIWLADKLYSSAAIERKAANLLQRLAEKNGHAEEVGTQDK